MRAEGESACVREREWREYSGNGRAIARRRVACHLDYIAQLCNSKYMSIEQKGLAEAPRTPTAFHVERVIRKTPRSNPHDSEDRAEVVETEDSIDLLIADGATGLGNVKIEGKAPGWFAAEWLTQIFREYAGKLTPRKIIEEANRTLRAKLLELVARAEITEQQMTDLCSAVCVVAHIDKPTQTLAFAATKADCWLLVKRADGSCHWLTSHPPTDMDFGPIKGAYDLQRSGIIAATKGSLNHPAVLEHVLRGRRDANDPSGQGNGRVNGAADEHLALYLEENNAAPFKLQPGDRIFMGTDGFVPLMSKGVYEEPDEALALERGRKEQRAFVEEAIEMAGGGELLRRITKREEREDPEGNLYPRLKDHAGDDKALIEVTVHASVLDERLPRWMSGETRGRLLAFLSTPPSDLSSEEYEQRLLSYLSDFCWRYADAIHALYEGDVLGGRARMQRIKTKKGGDWIRAGEACIAAGIFAELIAKEMHLPSEQASEVTRAAILHDWFKRNETAAVMPAFEAAKRSTDDEALIAKKVRVAFDQAKIEDVERLASLGFSPDGVRFSGENVPRTPTGVPPQDVQARIIYYLDMVLLRVLPVRYEERLGPALEKGSVHYYRGEAMKPEIGDKSFLEFQYAFGPELEKFFAEKLGYSGEPHALPFYLRALLAKAVQGVS